MDCRDRAKIAKYWENRNESVKGRTIFDKGEHKDATLQKKQTATQIQAGEQLCWMDFFGKEHKKVCRLSPWLSGSMTCSPESGSCLCTWWQDRKYWSREFWLSSYLWRQWNLAINSWEVYREKLLRTTTKKHITGPALCWMNNLENVFEVSSYTAFIQIPAFLLLSEVDFFGIVRSGFCITDACDRQEANTTSLDLLTSLAGHWGQN